MTLDSQSCNSARYDRILARLATCSRISDLSSAIRARSKSMSTVGLASRSSARFLAASARAMSISSRRLGDLGQDRHAIGLHLGEAERDRQVVLLLALAVPQLARRRSSASSGVWPGRTPK